MNVVEGGLHAQDRLWALLQRVGGSYTRGSWQARTTAMRTLETGPVTVMHAVSDSVTTEQDTIEPDLPWAEDHFHERVSGEPLNPAPSFLHWPWHSSTYARDHAGEADVFDHTYPERFWPVHANPDKIPHGQMMVRKGIRYDYGDLRDVVEQLKRDPFTRQAYLPIFFPEDTGATQGQRVPCSLGYHFIRQRECLDVHYALRSCDLTRHFRNDLYLTVRLLQWMCAQVRHPAPEEPWPIPGTVYMTIHNLHVFEPDMWRYK